MPDPVSIPGTTPRPMAIYCHDCGTATFVLPQFPFTMKSWNDRPLPPGWEQHPRVIKELGHLDPVVVMLCDKCALVVQSDVPKESGFWGSVTGFLSLFRGQLPKGAIQLCVDCLSFTTTRPAFPVTISGWDDFPLPDGWVQTERTRPKIAAEPMTVPMCPECNSQFELDEEGLHRRQDRARDLKDDQFLSSKMPEV